MNFCLLYPISITYLLRNANISAFSTPITYSCADDTALPGIDAARFIMSNASLTTDDTDWSPLFNGDSFFWNETTGFTNTLPFAILNHPLNN